MTSYFVIVKDSEQIARFTFWLKNTEHSYNILKDLIEASETGFKFVAPKVKSLSYQVFLKTANQQLLTLRVGNPGLECPKLLMEISQVTMILVENHVIKDSLVGKELRDRFSELENEKAALSASGTRVTNARLNDLRSAEPVATGSWGLSNKRHGSDLSDYEPYDDDENSSKLARMEDSACYSESQRYQSIFKMH